MVVNKVMRSKTNLNIVTSQLFFRVIALTSRQVKNAKDSPGIFRLKRLRGCQRPVIIALQRLLDAQYLPLLQPNPL